MAKDPADVPPDTLTASTTSAATSTPSLARNCAPGTRLASYKVLNQSDARPWHLHHKMPSDGRFRLVVFAGDITQPPQKEAVNKLGGWLATELLPRYKTIRLSPGSDPHGGTMRFRTRRDPSVVDVLTVHAAPREAVELLRDLHEVYHPRDERLGWDYDKVFVDGESYHEGFADAYGLYGVDRGRGAVVGVRPDGYVGLVTSVDEQGAAEIGRWFADVLRPV